MKTCLVSVFCPDRTGLVAAITGRLFDLGADLGDTSFAVLGRGAEFTSVCDLPDDVSAEEVAEDLGKLEELQGAEIEVRPFTLSSASGPSGKITHRIAVSGGDQPGLVARLTEVFGEFRANIVRLDAQRLPSGEGSTYVTRFSVSIPEEAVESCLNTIENTAGEMGLSCHSEAG
ncbi:glycine cleavage system protein R [Telmatospirillum sp. J64-1]|uniref:glycine cleavage system protein R n=1 Tax=Telmatospirillum sp. J64-1 TaxID=2502183 RepID=UPI00115E7335|nr:ACT domain-containing protein [Telmatospirillum sp. J64-1]